jgi:hypothetical protein
MIHRWFTPISTALAAVLAGLFAQMVLPASALAHSQVGQQHFHIDCSDNVNLCHDVVESDDIFGHYVGHDEPETSFYSDVPGSGNSMRWELTLPEDPPGQASAGKSFNFQLHIAFWLSMVMCDTQSYPLQTNVCIADSDRNITDLTHHPGGALTELQFYPPGWRKGAFGSCDATKWCSALTIDSLSYNPITGQLLNKACAAYAGVEYINYAFITKDGHSQAPANPIESTLQTITPDPTRDLFMNSGDKLLIWLHDTAHGLKVEIWDQTTGQYGSMTASAGNGFGQIKYAPDPSTECTNIPYDFHPMYSTASKQSVLPWIADGTGITYSEEIGHFDYCTSIHTDRTCNGLEGIQQDQEPADADDFGCISASESSRVKVSGCRGGNLGFDGTSYQELWPDGDTRLHPTPVLFSSPLIGQAGQSSYSDVALMTDLPLIESQVGTCDIGTGAGCSLIPFTDDGTPATFYPFYSISQHGESCRWLVGNDVPGLTTQDFGKNAQYGQLYPVPRILPGGQVTSVFIVFRHDMTNPCGSR